MRGQQLLHVRFYICILNSSQELNLLSIPQDRLYACSAPLDSVLKQVSLDGHRMGSADISNLAGPLGSPQQPQRLFRRKMSAQTISRLRETNHASVADGPEALSAPD